MKHVRIAIGLAFWCAAGALLWTVSHGWGETTTPGGRPVTQLWQYYTSGRRLQLHLPPSLALSAGNPVLAADAQGSLQQVGVVLTLSEDGQTAEAALFPSAGAIPSAQAYYLSNPDSIGWVVQTLLPPARRQQIQEAMMAAFRENERDLLAALQPVLENSVRDAFGVLEQDLPLAVEHHRPQLEALASRFESEILKRELVPLVKQRIWPIVRRDSEPTVREIGAELWERVSVWSFVWRGAMDHFPLVRGRDRVTMELQRFVDEEAVPILTHHQGEYLEIIERIVRDVANDPTVQAGFRQSFLHVERDPQLRQILGSILQEAVVQNPHFWSALRRNVTSAESQAVMRLASDRFEPTVRRIGDIVLGTREDGLTPEFNRVLRQQVLLKDRQGIVLGPLPATDPPLPGTPIQARYSDESPAP